MLPRARRTAVPMVTAILATIAAAPTSTDDQTTAAAEPTLTGPLETPAASPTSSTLTTHPSTTAVVATAAAPTSPPPGFSDVDLVNSDDMLAINIEDDLKMPTLPPSTFKVPTVWDSSSDELSSQIPSSSDESVVTMIPRRKKRIADRISTPAPKRRSSNLNDFYMEVPTSIDFRRCYFGDSIYQSFKWNGLVGRLFLEFRHGFNKQI